MTDEQKIQHDYLIADFQATKAEITRRSNAQKTDLAAMVAFYAWLLNQFVSTSLGIWHIGAVWIVTILGYFVIPQLRGIGRR
jgi:antibiotic biosynthesis monooxygenase (ABM) superfamily enzyme